MQRIKQISVSGIAAKGFVRPIIFCGALACLAAPLMAQVAMTPLPFGQGQKILTPLPFGQKNKSPLKSLTATSELAVAAQWNMDETSGNTMVDSSGNGNNGTTTNVTMSPDGYVFDGTSSKVVVPSSATLNPGTQDFSFSARVQIAVAPAKGVTYEVIRKGTSIATGGEYRLEIYHSNGKARAHCDVKDQSGAIANIKGGPFLSDNLVHTITCTKSATGLTMQVDAAPPLTTAVTLTGLISSPKPLTVGVKQSTLKSTPSDFYKGIIRSATVSVAPPSA